MRGKLTLWTGGISLQSPSDLVVQETKYQKRNGTVHTAVILQQGNNGQLVRKLFQPGELSTVMQEENGDYLCISNRLCNKSTQTFRRDADASRLFAILQI